MKSSLLLQECRKVYQLLSVVGWPVWCTLQVVDLINGLQKDVRPKVLISGTAVGYYGMYSSIFFSF